VDCEAKAEQDGGCKPRAVCVSLSKLLFATDTSHNKSRTIDLLVSPQGEISYVEIKLSMGLNEKIEIVYEINWTL
jgi:hypothetical protein